MAKLIGGLPNQVPTNGDLGTMAFMDYDVVAPQFLAGGRRNLIINGAMQVAQRGTQVTGATTIDYFTCDRFKFFIGNLGTWTVDQSTDSPNGFSNSLKLTATTADASPASGDYAVLVQYIEAQNLQHLAFGTSDAKQLTMSFWVKSNKTGNATFEIMQKDNNNIHRTFSYSINVADTWEYKTISIPADTSGNINNDSGVGFEIDWWLNSGSTFTGGSHPATWTTQVNANRNPSNIGVGGATSDYFAITGVQLEVGSVATPFEHRSYGEELALCQRYYQDTSDAAVGFSYTYSTGIFATAGNYITAPICLPVPMRAAPTVTIGKGSTTGVVRMLHENANGYVDSTTAFATSPSKYGFGIGATHSSVATAGHRGWYKADAEL